ncbi:MAG TPA: hypothetical protein VHQ24_04040 [Lachnospiraceae bacterium]|nr:hypothetical protein [Lachnospiraceae bacterium]HEX3076020.1 hypothetical protein [Lachnospiraceae bacterium]
MPQSKAVYQYLSFTMRYSTGTTTSITLMFNKYSNYNPLQGVLRRILLFNVAFSGEND